MAEDIAKTKPPELLACPCCGYATLAELNAFEICDVCWWEDDGQDNIDANTILGGPNADLSLTRARFNFLKHGIFDPRRDDLRARQESTQDCVKIRVFELDEATNSVAEPAAGWRASLADEVRLGEAG